MARGVEQPFFQPGCELVEAGVGVFLPQSVQAGDGGGDAGMAVAEDEGAEGGQVVDVAVAVHVVEVTAPAVVHEKGGAPAHRCVGAARAVDPAHDGAARPGKECRGALA